MTDTDELSPLNPTRKGHKLEITFSPDEYSLLVSGVRETSKKALTNFAKGCILAGIGVKPFKPEDEWMVYTNANP